MRYAPKTDRSIDHFVVCSQHGQLAQLIIGFFVSELSDIRLLCSLGRALLEDSRLPCTRTPMQANARNRKRTEAVNATSTCKLLIVDDSVESKVPVPSKYCAPEAGPSPLACVNRAR
jgi:hypothetical protein